MKSRIYFLDNLRTFLILMVVVLHSGLVYEAVLENTWIVVDPVKNNSIGLIRMYLDLFVMFSIFFISGYFVRHSAKNKSAIQFVKSKFKRILLPWVLAVFTLIPAYKFIFLYSRGLPQEEWFSYFHFFERSGTDLYFYANNPNMNWLWFLPVLFLFQVLYLGLVKTNLLRFRISLKTSVIVFFILGVVYSMVLSQFHKTGWVDTAILHFQNERILIYFMSFLLGSLCNRLGIFEKDNKNKRRYIIVNVVLTIAMGIFTAFALNLFFNLINPGRNYYFISDFFDRLMYYVSAVVLMFSFLYVLIYVFRYNLNKINPILKELNANSYLVYIIHTIVLGVIAITLIGLPVPAFLKFIILIILTFLLSNMLIYSFKKTIQKTVNMKTISTFVITALIFGAAFQGFPESKANISELSNQNQKVNLHELIIINDLEGIKQALKNGSDINEKDAMGGSTPLITACVFDKTEIAKELIKQGADINLSNNEGSTALHTAAFFCRPEIVKALLKNGIDRNVKNNVGTTAKETVEAPFSTVKPIYEYFAKTLAPLGLQLDMARIEKTRPEIAKILKKESN